jgi:DNA modification methylase
MNLNSVYHDDCFNILKIIPDESIDMILCDLPYNTTKAKWDKALDLELLWKEYKRIIKPNGAILLFAQTPFDKILGCSNLEWLKYEWIWEKTQATGFLNAKKMPLKAHENILVFYKKPPTYNPQKTVGHKPMHSYTKKPEIQNKTELYGSMNKTISGGGDTDRFPRSVLRFASDKQKNKLNGTIHPTQKPLALCEYLIKTYTNEEDIVLDNTAGSGTTGLAAKNLNRNYILVEKELKWVEVIKKRIPDIDIIS